MISEYETSAAPIGGEHELSREELAKFTREELPRIVDEVLDELIERFDACLGLHVAPEGLPPVTAMKGLPAFCQALLGNPGTRSLCLAGHTPQESQEEDAVERCVCHAGIRFDSLKLSVAGLGAATVFGIEGEKPARISLDVVLEISAFFAKKLLAQKIEDLARSRNENLAKQMFLHEAAHGIASVESTFSGLEDLLRDYVGALSREDREDVDRFFTTLKREYQIHRMTLDNLLAYYHPAAYAELQRSAVVVCNPAEILRELLPLYMPLAEARNVRVEEDLKGWLDMPRIRLDRPSIARAFHNVIWNAVKYSYKSIVNSTTPTDRYIRILCRPLYNPGWRGEGKECSIEIENYGLGISPEEISRVTRPAVRGEAAIREKVLGSGLGLYETERIVRGHGGRLRITSKKVHSSTYVTRVFLIFPYRTSLA